MDYDIELQVVHAALLKADNLRNYKKLTNRGGNEEDFDNVVKIIRDVLIEKTYIHPNGTINNTYSNFMRNAAFFLVLNSDLDILNKLVNIDDLEHLIWKAPEIPKCLLTHIFWKLKLDEYLYEIIKYSSQDLSLELLQAFKDNLKYIDPVESIRKARKLICSAYESVNRMFHDLERMKYDVNMLNQFYECISYLVSFLSMDPPNRGKMEKWKKNRRVEHEGFMLCNLIDCIYTCFSIFIMDVNENIIKHDMYRCTFNGALNLSEKRDNITDVINHYLNKLNSLLTDAFKEAFKNITVDKLLLWFDINIKGSSQCMQTFIGEKAYRLQMLLDGAEAFDKEMCVMLSGISQRPKTLAEIIQAADSNTILENAMKPSPDQQYWIEALIKNKCFFDDESLIELVHSNIDIIIPDDVIYIFEKGYEVIQLMTNDRDLAKLKSLMLSCFKKLPLDRKKTVIANIVDTEPFENSLESPNYFTELTSYLNKTIEMDSNPSETYNLFVQNPALFYERCVKIGISNLKQAVNVMNILRQLKLCEKPLLQRKNYLTVYHGDMSHCGFVRLALNAIQCIKKESVLCESEKQSFLFLLSNMISEQIVDANTLVCMEFYPRLIYSLKEKDFSMTQVYLEALDTIFIEEHLPKTLKLIGLVIEKSRWDLWNYNASAAILLNHTIKLSKKYLNLFTETYRPLRSEYTTMCRCLHFLSPLNRHHFKILWGTPFDTPQYAPVGEFKTDVLQLSLILHSLTLSEVKQVYSDLQSKYSITQSLHLLCKTAVTLGRIVDHMGTNNIEAASCLLYTCRNVAYILMDCLSLDASLSSMIDILVHIIRLINSRQMDKQEETLDCFISVVSKMVQLFSQDPEILRTVLTKHPLENPKCMEMMNKMLCKNNMNNL